jgi:arsenate reductase-like glutaredoxin family protein
MIQIIGTKKCKETAKAIRSCKERNLPFQFVDLAQRSLSEGEWDSLFRTFEPLSLIDSESAYYKKQGYEYREFDPREELVEHPELLKTPILRSKGRVHACFDLEVLKRWGEA